MSAQLCLGILFMCGAVANAVFAPGPSYMITFALAGMGIVLILNARRKKPAGEGAGGGHDVTGDNPDLSD